jgi:hypothetical protein
MLYFLNSIRTFFDRCMQKQVLAWGVGGQYVIKGYKLLLMLLIVFLFLELQFS